MKTRRQKKVATKKAIDQIKLICIILSMFYPNIFILLFIQRDMKLYALLQWSTLSTGNMKSSCRIVFYFLFIMKFIQTYFIIFIWQSFTPLALKNKQNLFGPKSWNQKIILKCILYEYHTQYYKFIILTYNSNIGIRDKLLGISVTCVQTNNWKSQALVSAMKYIKCKEYSIMSKNPHDITIFITIK